MHPWTYEIWVEGQLDERWGAWFDGLQVCNQSAGRASLTGAVADQAALHGILARIRDLGVPLLALRRLAPPQPATPQHPDPHADKEEYP